MIFATVESFLGNLCFFTVVAMGGFGLLLRKVFASDAAKSAAAKAAMMGLERLFKR